MEVERNYYNAEDVAIKLGISQSKAYEVMRELNAELKSDGYLIVRGKVSKQFLDEKIYQGKVARQ